MKFIVVFYAQCGVSIYFTIGIWFTLYDQKIQKRSFILIVTNLKKRTLII